MLYNIFLRDSKTSGRTIKLKQVNIIPNHLNKNRKALFHQIQTSTISIKNEKNSPSYLLYPKLKITDAFPQYRSPKPKKNDVDKKVERKTKGICPGWGDCFLPRSDRSETRTWSRRRVSGSRGKGREIRQRGSEDFIAESEKWLAGVGRTKLEDVGWRDWRRIGDTMPHSSNRFWVSPFPVEIDWAHFQN